MDAARAILISLGVVLHSAVIFSTEEWRINANETSTFFTNLIEIIHSFRMESFFIISGFFSMMMVRQKSVKYFIRNRITRLGIPLIFCLLTINIIAPAVTQYSTLHHPEFWIGGHWTGHLWFLSNLIAYSLLASIFFHLTSPKLLNWIESIKINYLLVLILFTVLLSISKYIAWKFPKSSYGSIWILIDLNYFVYYSLFYAFGFIVYLNQSIQNNFIPKIGLNLGLFLGATIIVKLTKMDTGFHYELLKSINSITLSAIVLSLFYHFMNKQNELSRRFSDASYSIYVLHQPIIIIWGTYVLTLDMNIYLSFVIICIPTLLLSYYIHRQFISRINILSILFNGKKLTPQPKQTTIETQTSCTPLSPN